MMSKEAFAIYEWFGVAWGVVGIGVILVAILHDLIEMVVTKKEMKMEA